MARGLVFVVAALGTAGLMLASGPADAGVSTRRSHRVASGESLWKIARSRGCTVDDLRKANRLRGDALQPGQKLRIPRCGRAEEDARARKPRDHRGDARRSEARREQARLEEDLQASTDAPGMDRPSRRQDADVAVDSAALTDMGVPDEEPIDPDEALAGAAAVGGLTEGAPAERAPVVAMIDPGAVDRLAEELDHARAEEEMGALERGRRTAVGIGIPLAGQSFGRPQNGYLVSGTHMPVDPKAYFLRRPERAFGTRHAVDQVVGAIRAVRRRFPRVHPLAIGDFSARHGGRLTLHGSHQSGRDADLGFYFRKQPRGYPAGFAVATADNLDFPATWALITVLLGQAGKPAGVERIYMTYKTQALFHRLARKHGVPRARLDEWFQYPHGRRAQRGIIRHEPGHTEHIHVRFRCASDDPECR